MFSLVMLTKAAVEMADCVKFGDVNNIKKLTLKVHVTAMSLQSVRRAITWVYDRYLLEIQEKGRNTWICC